MEGLFYPLGDCAVVIQLGEDIDMQTHQKVIQFSQHMEQNPFIGFVECVPTFTTVTVYYDPYHVWMNELNALNSLDANPKWSQSISPYEIVCKKIQPFLASLQSVSKKERNVIQIPVCYGGEFGPDLEFVAKHNGMERKEVIQHHTKPIYPVYMIGFAPGFPYLGGMSERIAAPRRSSPRSVIPAGSVGIAGKQTGIYPIESPGGWQIIGRTPLPLFRPDHHPPSLLTAGDRVRFYEITRETYDAWGVEST